MKIIQISNALTYGDGLTNCIFYLSDLFNKYGINNSIAARVIDSRINEKNIILFDTVADILIDDEDIVIYTFAIGIDLNEEVELLRCKKILLYQNVTPPDFYKYIDTNTMLACVRGKFDAKYTAGNYLKCITPSHFSESELIGFGWDKKDICVVPIIDSKDSRVNPDKKIIDKYSDGLKNIIFVGRVVQNKRHEDIICVFNYYQKYYNKDCRLIFVGSNDVEVYTNALENHIESLGVKNVLFSGHVTEEELAAYYSCADLFLCLSEHEGLCLPVLEAMKYKIPVIAYKAAALPDTMGDAGVLVETKDEKIVAREIDKIFTDTEYRNAIIESQYRHAKSYNLCEYERCLLDCIEEVRLIHSYRYAFEDNFVIKYLGKKKSLEYQRTVEYGEVINFTENSNTVLIKGFSAVEDGGCWICNRNAEINIPFEKKDNIKITFRGIPLTDLQRAHIKVNGEFISEIVFRESNVITVPAEYMNGKNIAVEIESLDLTKPRYIFADSDDDREMSFRLNTMVIEKINKREVEKVVKPKKKSRKDASILAIIVNYKAEEYLPGCIESLYSGARQRKLDICVVNNNETFGTTDFLYEKYSDIQIVDLGYNAGFGGANNIAIKKACEKGYDYVLLINPDTIVDRDMLTTLFSFSSGCEILSPTIYADKEYSVPWYCGGVIDYDKIQVRQDLYKSNLNQRRCKKKYEVDFVSGCCMLIPTDVFRKIGIFDDGYFLYYEDVDFCIRAKKANISMRYVTDAKMWHRIGGSNHDGGDNTILSQYYAYRNRRYCMEKNACKSVTAFMENLRIINTNYKYINTSSLRYYVEEAARIDYENKNYGKGKLGRYILEENFMPVYGFSGEEQLDNKRIFRATCPTAEFIVTNNEFGEKNVFISFEVELNNEDENQVVSVNIDGKTDQKICGRDKVYIAYKIPGRSFVRINLAANNSVSPKKLPYFEQYFTVSNINIEMMLNEVEYVGFYYEEHDEKETWRWASTKTSYAIVPTNPGTNEVEFCIDFLPGNEDTQIKLEVDGKYDRSITEPGLIRVKFEDYAKTFHSFKWIVLGDIAKGPGEDKRNLAFKIKNYKLINDFCCGFSEAESKDGDVWRWANRKECFTVFKADRTIKEIQFCINPPPGRDGVDLRIIVDGQCYYDIKYPGVVNICFDYPSNTHYFKWIVKNEIVEGYDNDSRSFAFMLRNFQIIS